jgi:hypothetical protein
MFIKSTKMSKERLVRGVIHQSDGELTVDSVGVNPKFPKDNQHRAQLRQVITNDYPNMQLGNSKQSNVFEIEDFGKSAIKDSYAQTRIAFIPVPVGTTVEQVKARLAMFPNARIYREVSYKLTDVLSDAQLHNIEAGTTKLEDTEVKKRAVMDTTKDVNDPARYYMDPQADGSKKMVYRSTWFSADGKLDQDYRDKYKTLLPATAALPAISLVRTEQPVVKTSPVYTKEQVDAMVKAQLAEAITELNAAE